MEKYVQNFNGEITVMIDQTNIPDKPYGVYSFVGNTLVGSFYFEEEIDAQHRYERIVKKLKGEI